METKFTVTPSYPSGYYISIGIGKKFYAKNLDEVHVAMEHYFCSGQYILHPPSRGSTAADKCPLCRE